MFNGFSYDEIVKVLKNKNSAFSYGEVISPHTVKKIEYIKKYVEQWLFVIVNVSDYIFFIDAMSNAGLYENGFLSTSIEVLNVFVKYAVRHPEKQFFLISNDYDETKVGTMKEIFNVYKEKLIQEKIYNIKTNMFGMDACDFLTKFRNQYHVDFVKGKKKSVLLYVDPYNFISAKLAYAVKDFVSNVYCELVLNFYCNDYSRNVNNSRCKVHQAEIKEVMRDFCHIDDKKFVKVEDLRDVFTSRMMLGTKMKYRYFVNMKNEKNAPLYYLIYLTPNIRGLEKVKDATWAVLGHHDEYCVSYKERDADIPNLFNETPEDEAFAIALEKINPLLLNEEGKVLTFENIEEVCLQHSFMKESHIINKVIKPFIADKKLKKEGKVNNRNFKEDSYIVLRKDWRA